MSQRIKIDLLFRCKCHTLVEKIVTVNGFKIAAL